MKKLLLSLLFITGTYAETVQIQSVASGKCLDVPNLSSNNHVKIQQYVCRGSNDRLLNAQLWRFKRIKGKIQIQSVASGKCLDVPNLSSNNHIKIQQYECRGSTDRLLDAQLWRLD